MRIFQVGLLSLLLFVLASSFPALSQDTSSIRGAANGRRASDAPGQNAGTALAPPPSVFQ